MEILQEILRFEEWQREYWETLERHMREVEIAARPKYITLFQKSKNLHIATYIQTLKNLADDEQEAREMMERMSEKMPAHKELMEHLFNNPDITEEEFIQNLAIVQDQKDR